MNDAKRGQAFTKAANVISIAAREGGPNPDMNFKLRLAMDAARTINMPKENIERAINRGAGIGSGAALEALTYEGFAPHGVALVVETVTDNKARTASNVRSIFDKNGGTMAGPGSVSWMFKTVGAVTVKVPVAEAEEVAFEAADYGATDFEIAGEVVTLYCEPADLEKLKEYIGSKGFEITSSELNMIATNLTKLEDVKSISSVLGLIEKLEDLDDVQKVHANFEAEDALIAQVAG